MLPPVGLIGYGNMGEALALGLVRKKLAAAVHVLEHNGAARARALKNRKLTLHDSLESLTQVAALVVIAIKPQDIPALLTRLRPLISGKAVVSVAAGLSTAYFQKELGIDQVVRFIPNLAARVGKSLVGVSPGVGCGPTVADQALTLAGAAGHAVTMPEKLLAAITGLSGSGLAFVFQFIHALALGGVREGFAYPAALSHALDTVDGATALLRETGEHPVAFASRVASPSGTTIEGLKALERGGLTDTVIEAVSAAARRAHELER